MTLKSIIKWCLLLLIFTTPLSQLTGCTSIPETFNVIVENGTGSGEYIEGDTVTIKADDPEIGEEFFKWELTGLIVNDLTKRELTFTMPANDVTATALFEDSVYEIALENCTADKENAVYGEKVTFTANEYTGKEFSSWNIKGVDTTGLDLSKSPITITMPANDVTATALFEDIDYTISVLGGTADKTTAHYGEIVTVTLGEVAPGREFAFWSILEGLDPTNLDLTKPKLTFEMPACNVRLMASFNYFDYNVTIIGGTAQIDDDAEPTSSLLASYGTVVSIFANESNDKRFIRWTSENEEVVFEDETSPTTTFSMPASNVNIVAEFEQLYQIEVEKGCTTNKQFAAEGEEVTVTKPAPELGHATRWAIEGIEVDWPASTHEGTFIMPANNVVVGYIKVLLNYFFQISGGTATGIKGLEPFSVTNGSGGFDYNCDVTITANVPIGKTFVNWTISGIDTSGLDLTQSTLVFKMPANAVTVTANFEYVNYTISVKGGTADKTTAHYGESVTITANVPADKEFVMWSFDGLAPDSLDVTQPELTFVMPANNVTVTAVFENKPLRLEFVSNVAESGNLAFTSGESKRFVVSMGTLGTLPMKYTFTVSGIGKTTLHVFDKDGVEMVLTEQSITLDKAREDYIIVLKYEGSKTTFLNLKITQETLPNN